MSPRPAGGSDELPDRVQGVLKGKPLIYRGSLDPASPEYATSLSWSTASAAGRRLL